MLCSRRPAATLRTSSSPTSVPVTVTSRPGRSSQATLVSAPLVESTPGRPRTVSTVPGGSGSSHTARIRTAGVPDAGFLAAPAERGGAHLVPSGRGGRERPLVTGDGLAEAVRNRPPGEGQQLLVGDARASHLDQDGWGPGSRPRWTRCAPPRPAGGDPAGPAPRPGGPRRSAPPSRSTSSGAGSLSKEMINLSDSPVGAVAGVARVEPVPWSVPDGRSSSVWIVRSPGSHVGTNRPAGWSGVGGTVASVVWDVSSWTGRFSSRPARTPKAGSPTATAHVTVTAALTIRRRRRRARTRSSRLPSGSGGASGGSASRSRTSGRSGTGRLLGIGEQDRQPATGHRQAGRHGPHRHAHGGRRPRPPSSTPGSAGPPRSGPAGAGRPPPARRRPDPRTTRRPRGTTPSASRASVARRRQRLRARLTATV